MGFSACGEAPPQAFDLGPVPDESLRVRVVDESGRAISGALVALRAMNREKEEPEEGAIRLNSRWKRISLTSDEEGLAVFGEVEEGAWRAAAGLPPEWGFHFSEPLERGHATTIILKRLPEDRVLSGVVLLPDGQPKAGAFVRFVRNDRGQKKVTFAFTDEDGHFTLLSDIPAVAGALHASVHRNAFRSVAMDPITAGAQGLELRLAEPRFFELECRDQFGAEIEYVNASFSWQLAGFPISDQGGASGKPGLPARWELPDIPFYVSVSPGGHKRAWLGPLDPSRVGEKLMVTLQAYPKLRGRVTHGGKPLPKVSISIEGFGSLIVFQQDEEQPPSKWTVRARTDSEGAFAVPLLHGGEATLKAFSRHLGEGELGPITLDPRNLPQDLEVQITRDYGSIKGHVLFPPGHGPQEVLLSTSKSGGYMCVQPDGSFLLPGLPRGPIAIRILESDMIEEDLKEGPVPKGWMSMSHGPTRAPDWLLVEPTFETEVLSGQTVELDLDLVTPAPCRLQGQLLLDGAPPPIPEEQPFDEFGREPRVVLKVADSWGFVSRTELAPDGSFELWANKPGTYRLEIEFPTGGDSWWELIEQVALEHGVSQWAGNFESGSLKVLPRDADGKLTTFSGEVQWQGPGSLRIEVKDPDRDKHTRVTTYAFVPVGRIHLIGDRYRTRRVLFETGVVAGETTTVHSSQVLED